MFQKSIFCCGNLTKVGEQLHYELDAVQLLLEQVECSTAISATLRGINL
jgi:hypothetical protein